MNLYKEWEDKLKNIKTQEDYEEFWKVYYPLEAECYRKVLESKNPLIENK